VSLISLRERKETISIDDVDGHIIEEMDNAESEDEILIKSQISSPKQKDLPGVEKPKIDIKVKGKIDLESLAPKKQPVNPPAGKEKVEKEVPQPVVKKEEKEKKEVIKEKQVKAPEHIKTAPVHVEQPKVVGKVNLEEINQRTKPLRTEKEIESKKPKQAEKKKKTEERQARRQEILSRLNITVFNAEGKKLYGTPVQAGTDEWMALPDSSAAIECDWNAETQTASNPVCAFFVKKPASGKVKRVAEKTGLSFNDPTKKPSKNLQASGMRVFNIPGFDKPKPLVILDGETAKEVAKTVNSGTMVAIPISDEEFNIVALEKGSLKKICITKPIR